MNGDLILPQYNHPVQGNTHKAIGYQSQQDIFLSRRESFPLQTFIDMNNNIIQNVTTPTTGHQATNNDYVDYN